MNVKKAIPGATAVGAADFVSSKLPASIDFGGLPFRAGVTAVAGAYAGLYIENGSKPGIKKAALIGLIALAAAEVADCALTSKIGGGKYATFIRVGAGAASSMFVHLAD